MFKHGDNSGKYFRPHLSIETAKDGDDLFFLAFYGCPKARKQWKPQIHLIGRLELLSEDDKSALLNNREDDNTRLLVQYLRSGEGLISPNALSRWRE